MSRDGIVVVIVAIDKKTGTLIGRPDIVSKGFVDNKDGENILEQGRDLVASSLSHTGKYPVERSSISTKTKDTLSKFFYEQTKRRPMILPTTIEI